MFRLAASLLLLLCVTPGAHAQDDPEVPPWPYLEVAWKVRFFERLDEIKLRPEVEGRNLEHVIRSLASSSRLPIRPDATLRPKAHTVALKLAGPRTLRQILDGVCRGKPYTWVVHERAVVITRSPGRYPPSDTPGIRKELQQARMMPAIYDNLERMDAKNRSLERKISGSHVDHPSISEPGSGIAARLRRITGLPIELQAGLRISKAVRVSSGRGVRLSELLDKCTAPADLMWVVHRGKVWIGSTAFIAVKRKEAVQSREVLGDHTKAVRPIEEKQLTLNLTDVRLHQVGGALAKALGIPVDIDRKAWGISSTLALTVKDEPFRTIRTSITRQLENRVTFVITDGKAVYIIAK